MSFWTMQLSLLKLSFVKGIQQEPYYGKLLRPKICADDQSARITILQACKNVQPAHRPRVQWCCWESPPWTEIYELCLAAPYLSFSGPQYSAEFL